MKTRERFKLKFSHFALKKFGSEPLLGLLGSCTLPMILKNFFVLNKRIHNLRTLVIT